MEINDNDEEGAGKFISEQIGTKFKNMVSVEKEAKNRQERLQIAHSVMVKARENAELSKNIFKKQYEMVQNGQFCGDSTSENLWWKTLAEQNDMKL